MSGGFDLVVFDWDGTLMDSEARIVGALRAAVRDTGLPAREDRELRDIIGLGLIEACAALYPEHGYDDYHRLASAYKDRFFSAAARPAQLFDGAVATLERLAAAGYLLAVATGKSRSGLDQALRETGLARLIDASRCADEAGSKPHPRMLLELLDELGVAAPRAVMVGDTEYDLAMARAAGTRAVAVSYGVHAPERLLAFGPLACLDAIAELPALLEAHRGPGDGTRT